MFKVSIYLLKIHEKKLISMKFDDLMNYMTDFVKTEIFTNKTYLEFFGPDSNGDA